MGTFVKTGFLTRWAKVGGEGAVMTTTLNDVTKMKSAELSAEQQAAADLVRLAQCGACR
jgi:hypothetical protein